MPEHNEILYLTLNHKDILQLCNDKILIPLNVRAAIEAKNTAIIYGETLVRNSRLTAVTDPFSLCANSGRNKNVTAEQSIKPIAKSSE